jgi:phage baseplate assembly protein W
MGTTYGKDYKDFDLDFGKHPSHGDLLSVKKTTAINRSINNIIRTQAGERLFQPEIDGGLNALLFEPYGALTISRIKKTIKYAIGKYEPRADVKTITVVADEPNNAYLINIIYIPDNDVKETNIEVYLERT